MNKAISPKNKYYDVAIIGGGFYGCMIALHLKEKFKNVIIIERERDLLLKASYNNQARIHHGYHYPRSVMTALRSQANYSRFIKDFKSAVIDKSLMIYAIAADNSKTTTQQFLKFCKQLNLPIIALPEKIKKIFNNRLIENAFSVEEIVFDAGKLRKILKKKLLYKKVKIFYRNTVSKVSRDKNGICLNLLNGEKIFSKRVINCSYSNINLILKNSSLPLLPLKHELTEMPLVKMPPELSGMGITVIDGPFFSIMPFPNLKLHTIHHVRYTPHQSFLDYPKKKNNYPSSNSPIKKSRFIYMIKDAIRYIPLLSKVKYESSIYETKTVLIQNETTDARPILFKKNYGIDNFHVVMGGKIDNVYDVINEIDKVI